MLALYTRAASLFCTLRCNTEDHHGDYHGDYHGAFVYEYIAATFFATIDVVDIVDAAPTRRHVFFSFFGHSWPVNAAMSPTRLVQNPFP